MKKLFLLFVAFLISMISFAAVTYELNGGVTNDDNWLNKGDMFTACMTDAGVDLSKLGTLEEVKATKDPLVTICTPLGYDQAQAILDNAKWDWLEAYIMSVQNADATAIALVEGTTSAAWRYAIAAFFLESKRSSWPVSADFSLAGQIEAYQPAWKHGFDNPTETTAEFVLNTPYKEGSTFAGWYTTADFSGNKITTITAETTGTLYAKWVEYIPTIAEVRAINDGTEVKTSGVVNCIQGSYVYIQDITASIQLYISGTPSCQIGEKIIVSGTRNTYHGVPELYSVNILSSESDKTFAPIIFESLTPLISDSLELKYFAKKIAIQGLTITSYNSSSYPTVRDAAGYTALCHQMALDQATFPIGTKVDISAVAGWYDGFRFVGDAAGITRTIQEKQDTFNYPVRHNKYTLSNSWVFSNMEDNFASNKPGLNDYVRGMAVKDGKMYFINRGTQSITVIDGETGQMLDPIILQGTDTLFKSQTVNAEGETVWADGTTLPFNDIKFDQAGNCLIGAMITGATKCQTFYIYVVDLETGVCTKLIEDVLWENPGLDQVQFRFDAFGCAGDVTKNGVVMAADANGSWNVYRWLITDGVAGEGEQVAVYIDPATDQSLFVNAAGYGTAPQIVPQNEEGTLFYVDGFNTLPMLFYGTPEEDATLVDDFINVPTGVNVWNEEGDTIAMNANFNGLVEFQVGEEYFLLMVAANNTHNVPTTYALYKFANAERAFSGMEPLWYFPHNGFGTTTIPNRTAPVAVEVVDNTAYLYLYATNNGYARYELEVDLLLLKTNVNNPNMGTVSGSGAYARNEKASIAAIPKVGYHFVQWNDGNTDNPRTLTLTQDTTFTAEFAINQYTISTASSHDERGTTKGDTIADYLEYITITATPNSGYHFVQWKDGNTDNPRQVQVTQSKTYTAYFDKNTYYITKNYNSNQGYINGSSYGKYLDNINLIARANYGYHFVQWSDGVTDNPRSFVLTQDTTFAAEFAQSFSGQCGDNLFWSYDETTKTISITGFGNMYDYTVDTQPWLLFKEQIMIVDIVNTATSIGASAFEGCKSLGSVNIGLNILDIGANAFASCTRLYDIYCYPTYPPFAETSSFANYNVYLYVPCLNIREYDMDIVWGNFKYIECLGAESEPVAPDTIIVTPGTTDVTITWPTEDNAYQYVIEIKKDGEVFCTLTFSSEGQLLNIAFAPGRKGTHSAQYAAETANGLRFTVTGLEEGTNYTYDVITKDNEDNQLSAYSGEFTTYSNTPTNLENLDTQSPISNCQKLFRNGQLIIVRDGIEYNAMGQEL